MRSRHIVLPVLLTTVALAAPAVSQAATLTATSPKPCYGTNDLVELTGAGFTPSGRVTVQQGQIRLPDALADAAGSFSGRAPVQRISSNEEVVPYTATDQTDPAIVAATVPLRFSRVLVSGTRAGDNGLIQRVKVRGFTAGGRRLYAHVRRAGRKVKDIKLGRLKGACRTLNVKKRFFTSGANAGKYTLYFDTYRRYRKRRLQQFKGTITVRRVVRSSAAAFR